MRNMLRNVSAVLFGAVLLSFLSCNKEPGPGGQASIQGKIKVDNYNALCVYVDSYYGPDEEVYIIYGDEPASGDRVRTAPDGTYMFRFLRPGKYKVYCYSEICNASTGPNVEAVIAEVEITGKKQEIVVPDIIVRR